MLACRHPAVAARFFERREGPAPANRLRSMRTAARDRAAEDAAAATAAAEVSPSGSGFPFPQPVGASPPPLDAADRITPNQHVRGLPGDDAAGVPQTPVAGLGRASMWAGSMGGAASGVHGAGFRGHTRIEALKEVRQMFLLRNQTSDLSNASMVLPLPLPVGGGDMGLSGGRWGVARGAVGGSPCAGTAGVQVPRTSAEQRALSPGTAVVIRCSGWRLWGPTDLR